MLNVLTMSFNKTMSFKVADNKLPKKYNKIWERGNNLLSIKFDSEPAYGDNDKYINTNFHGKKIPKENTSYKSLSPTMLDSGIRANKKYYL